MTLEAAIVEALLPDPLEAQAPDLDPAGFEHLALTPREQEIAALIARGLSNRQLAERLVISHGTAQRHVANILAKLGYASRVQVAAWALEHALPGARPG